MRTTVASAVVSSQEGRIGADALDRKKFFNDNLAIVGSNLFSILIGLPVGFVLPLWLSPFDYGVIGTVALVLGYVKNYHLGTFHALSQQIPYARGRGEGEIIGRLQDSAFTFLLLASGVVVVGIGVAVRLLGSWQRGLVIGLQIAALTLCVEQLFGLYTRLLRSDHRFGLISRATVVNSILGLLVTIPAVYYLRLYGYFWAGLLIVVATTTYLAVTSGYRLHCRLSLTLLSSMFAFGLPLIAADLVMIFSGTLDRLVLVRWLGIEQLGLYQFAMIFHGLILMLPGTIAGVLFPRLSELYGRTGSIPALGRLVMEPVLFIGHTMIVVLGLFMVVGPAMVALFFKPYLSSILTMQILVAATFFRATQQIFLKLLVSIRRPYISLVFYLLSIGVNILSLWIFATAGGGLTIEKVAWAASLSAFVMFSGLSLYCLFRLTEGPGRMAARYGEMMLPFGVMVGAFLLVNRFAALLGGGALLAGSELLPSLVRYALMLLLCSPLVYLYNRRTGLLTEVYALLRAKVAGLPPGDR